MLCGLPCVNRLPLCPVPSQFQSCTHVITRIFEFAKGLPRHINQVCATPLMAGLIDQKQILDETTIRKAIAELDHD